jgi:hypothetical protein
MKLYLPLRPADVCRLLVIAAVVLQCSASLEAQVVIPGTGQKVADFGDDFEDEAWEFIPNLPKSSREQDNQERQPTGYSTNGRWFESPKRGMPDLLKRVETPEGGLPGSKGSLLMQSLYTGIPNRPGASLQDDLLLSGVNFPVSQSPNFVVRVYLPPFEKWENNTGTSFGLRAGLRTTKLEKQGKFFRSRKSTVEPYWPGMFIQFNSETSPQIEKDSAFFIIRGDQSGQDITGPEIKQVGWWTLGMSITPNGAVHYFASPGVDNLTMADHIYSSYPYGYRAESCTNFFFNVANRNDGRNWSTEWIIDDPTLYTGGFGGYPREAGAGGNFRR